MGLKKEVWLYFILFSFILSSFAVYGFTTEEVLEGELINVTRPLEIKDTKQTAEGTHDEANKSINKKVQQQGVSKDNLLKESKNYFAKYWYVIASIGIIVLLTLFLIYRQNKRKPANLESYQNTQGYKQF